MKKEGKTHRDFCIWILVCVSESVVGKKFISCSFFSYNSSWDNYTHTFFSFLRQFSFFFFSLFFLLCLCLALSFKQQIILTTADQPHGWLRATTTRKTDAANIIIDRQLTGQRDFKDEKNDGKQAPIRNWAINNSNKHHYHHHSLLFSFSFSFFFFFSISFIISIITISSIIHNLSSLFVLAYDSDYLHHLFQKISPRPLSRWCCWNSTCTLPWFYFTINGLVCLQ